MKPPFYVYSHYGTGEPYYGVKLYSNRHGAPEPQLDLTFSEDTALKVAKDILMGNQKIIFVSVIDSRNYKRKIVERA